MATKRQSYTVSKKLRIIPFAEQNVKCALNMNSEFPKAMSA